MWAQGKEAAQKEKGDARIDPEDGNCGGLEKKQLWRFVWRILWTGREQVPLERKKNKTKHVPPFFLILVKYT